MPSDPSTHLTAGAISGLINCLTLQPLDLLKTRLQQKQHSTLFSTAQKIAKDQGVFGLWRGTLPTIIRNVPGSALYFGTLHITRSILPVSPTSNFLSGAFSRVAVGFLLMPFTVIKARYESDLFQYKSILDGFRSIVKKDGIKGLFYGFGSTALRDAPFAGLYVFFYEHSKQMMQSIYPQVSLLFIHASSAMNSGFLATALTHPFDVLRTRIQLQPQYYQNTLKGTKIIYKEEGLIGFFSGISPRIIRKTLSAVITWTLYEQILIFLSDKK